MLRTLVTTTDVDSTEKVYSIAGKKPQHTPRGRRIQLTFDSPGGLAKLGVLGTFLFWQSAAARQNMLTLFCSG